MRKCVLCSKSGEDLSLFGANHKELGYIMVCQECWIKLNEENLIISGSGSSSGSCSCR
ncbi:MAG: hypothetical protein QXI71_03320 [Candidatus Bathyarchaeia archaeon]|nr:hypothetical protein [Candidatus Bathyarchaeota archaeon]